MLVRRGSPLVAVLVGLSACWPWNGGGGGGGGDGGEAAASSTATRVVALSSVDECPSGGVQVETGIDENQNGRLDDDEVDEVVIVCNGTNGTNGSSALTRVDDEPPGPNCANGGTAVRAGIDDDGDGALADTEVDSTRFVCDGTDGTDGSTILVRVDDEPPGDNCLEGGIAVYTGVDANGDNVLDDTEAGSDPRYVCDGPTADNAPCGVIEGSMTVSNSLDIRALQGCTAVVGSLTIDGALSSLAGLESLNRLGRLSIYGDGPMTTLRGLDNLVTIDDDLVIEGTALVTLQGLENLAVVGGRLFVSENPRLTDLDALAGLEQVGGPLAVDGNCVLPPAAAAALATRLGVGCDCNTLPSCGDGGGDEGEGGNEGDEDGNGLNDPVDAVDDRVLAERDVPLSLPLAALLENDSDPDGDARIGAVFAATNLRVVLGGPTVFFAPAPGFTGTASFRYTLVNVGGAFDTAQVTVDVAGERCGSGAMAGTEECDDGNTDADDGCGPTCRFEVCGDGIVQANEDCDDGADGDDADGCTDRCEAERCGDGDLDAGEECDDGNDVGFDGCSAACIVEYCGDGAVNLQIRPTALRFEWLATECMGPAETTLFVNGVPVGTSQPSYNGCFSDCGDSSETFATSDPAALALLRADGADVFGFLKRSYLAWAVVVVRYSDGRERETILADFSGGAASRRSDFCEGADGADVFDVLTATAEPQPIRDEQCDDGNNIDGDGCDTNCRVTACGNGVMTTGEQCDDGNRNDGDGCTAACRIEPCGDGLIHSREQCDDGNTTDGDGCDSNCRWTTCGNGIVTAGEQCDDGNTSSGDGCDALCAVEVFRAGDDRIVIERDVAQTVSLSLLVANDTAPNGAYIGSVFAPDNLRVELMDGADAVVATPAPGFIGTASFRYTLVAFDGTVTTALVTVEVVAERCGSGVIAGTEECDDGNTAGDDGCGPTCRIEFCGDGIVQANENCDDGANGDDADGCTDQCDADRCGDGDLDGTEECDDGNNVGLDGCSATCVIEFCGDGLVSPGARPTSIRVEWLATECNGPTEMTLYVNGEPVGTAPPSFNGCFDCGELPETFTTSNPAALALLRTDGADVFGFSKRSRLAWAVVVVRYSNGNERETIVADFSGGAASRFPDMCDQGSDGLSGGVLSAAADPFPLRGEECDDGNAVNGDGCDSNCRVTACSNGILTAGEQCDDGNTIDGDGCTAACRIEPCGDGLIHSREQCDDGNTTSGDGCDSNCRWTACGNGVVTAGEQCDDGNRDNDDGCDSFCVTERCGDGIVQRGIGEGCEDGNTESGDGCDANCTPTSCGNGIVTAGEECDDGNDANGDACDANCTAPRCGNGIVGDGEECDDLNTTDGDGCAADCVLEFCGDGIVNAARSQPVLIEFLWLASECGGESNVQFSLNGTQVADVPNGSRYCRCSPGVQFVSIEDPAVLALFRPGSVNEFGYRFVDEIGFAARTAWVIVQVHFDGWMQEDILVDESGGAGGRNGYLCGGFTEQVDQVFAVADVTSPAVVDECDDGNGDDGDGCSALCTVE